jgi:membrane protein implicated in regulation of membrane protease activity
MKNIRVYFMVMLILLTFTLSSCELVGDIFKAGMWVALIIIVIVVLLVVWIFRKLRGPRGPGI